MKPPKGAEGAFGASITPHFTPDNQPIGNNPPIITSNAAENNEITLGTPKKDFSILPMLMYNENRCFNLKDVNNDTIVTLDVNDKTMQLNLQSFYFFYASLIWFIKGIIYDIKFINVIKENIELNVLKVDTEFELTGNKPEDFKKIVFGVVKPMFLVLSTGFSHNKSKIEQILEPLLSSIGTGENSKDVIEIMKALMNILQIHIVNSFVSNVYNIHDNRDKFIQLNREKNDPKRVDKLIWFYDMAFKYQVGKFNLINDNHSKKIADLAAMFCINFLFPFDFGVQKGIHDSNKLTEKITLQLQKPLRYAIETSVSTDINLYASNLASLFPKTISNTPYITPDYENPNKPINNPIKPVSDPPKPLTSNNNDPKNNPNMSEGGESAFSETDASKEESIDNNQLQSTILDTDDLTNPSSDNNTSTLSNIKQEKDSNGIIVNKFKDKLGVETIYVQGNENQYDSLQIYLSVPPMAVALPKNHYLSTYILSEDLTDEKSLEEYSDINKVTDVVTKYGDNEFSDWRKDILQKDKIKKSVNKQIEFLTKKVKTWKNKNEEEERLKKVSDRKKETNKKKDEKKQKKLEEIQNRQKYLDILERIKFPIHLRSFPYESTKSQEVENTNYPFRKDQYYFSRNNQYYHVSDLKTLSVDPSPLLEWAINIDSGFTDYADSIAGKLSPQTIELNKANAIDNVADQKEEGDNDSMNVNLGSSGVNSNPLSNTDDTSGILNFLYKSFWKNILFDN